MLYYIATRPDLYTIRRHLRHYGRELSGCVRPRSYGRLIRARSLPAGSYIFADIERLGPDEILRAAHVRKALVDQGCVVLNDPVRSMRRYELLRTMFELGINRTNVYHVTEGRQPQRYPVFVRGENDHNGSQSELLNDQDQLQAAIEDLARRGISREQLIVTEFCETRDERGLYRKYSAFYVRGRIIPRHLFFGRQWMLKAPERFEPDCLEEEFAFHLANPHAEQLRKIFTAARIKYGRIDYGVEQGLVRVWEINTNPMISTAHDATVACRTRVQERFAPAFNQALRDLAENSPTAGSIRIPPLPVYRTRPSLWQKAIAAFLRRAA
jgi:hypothetical protein